MLGVLVPFGLALLIRRDWMWFIAHFCVLANGVYLATAWVSGGQYLDTPKQMKTRISASPLAEQSDGVEPSG